MHEEPDGLLPAQLSQRLRRRPADVRVGVADRPADRRARPRACGGGR
ncbi:MAG: hypothetical protein MZV64_49595 [Ignavibacteriales bacterium]|nr:hypothetical protein [Ignavibacteriales bacterium]